MSHLVIFGFIVLVIAVIVGFRLGWELLQQNGRVLLRLEAMDKRLKEIESGAKSAPIASPSLSPAPDSGKADANENGESESNDDSRADRFANRSLAHSKIRRDGLKAGTVAPEFRLSQLEGGELALSELRGNPVLLVFSSPHCGPCNALAPKLEKFHRKHPKLQLVMISKDDPEANREKVREHGLTFPVLLQKQWEISRDYAYFATPVAYLIDDAGVITAAVAVGTDGVEELMTRAARTLGRNASGRRGKSWPKFLSALAIKFTIAALQKPSAWLAGALSRLQLFELTHFKLTPRADDIFIVTYPRSGTTWMQMILYQLTSDGGMEISHIAEHCPWLERTVRAAADFDKRKSPRIFKSHLSYRDIPKGPGRYIYVARDGTDVAVSYYNLYRNYNGYKGTFDEFFDLFMSGKVHYGSWFKHVNGWWKHRHTLNILFLTYEELTRDLEGCLRRIIDFCHLTVPPGKLPAILERCRFEFMKQHESKFDPAWESMWEQGLQLNSFLRKGQIGEGSRELTAEQRVRFDEVFRRLLSKNNFMHPAQQPAAENAATAQKAYASV